MTETPRKLPRVFSCLIKAPLGCLAFTVGAAVVLVLFLPPALGRLASRSFEDWFGEVHHGSVELDEAWLGSVYGPQRIQSLILRDPEGDEVLRAGLRAPSLGPVVLEQAEHYGPVEVRISSLRVEQGADGRTTLERALALREGEHDTLPFSMQRGLTLALELVIDRLRFADPSGNEGSIEKLTFQGELERGPRRARLVLDGGDGSLRLRIEAEQLDELARPWRASVSFERGPVFLPELLLDSGGFFGHALGPEVDSGEVAWRNEASGERVLEKLLLEDGGDRIELRGRLGQVLFATEEGDSLVLEFGEESWCCRVLLPELLPVFSRLRPLEPAEHFRLTTSRLVWPLDGQLNRAEARFELALPRCEALLDPAVAGALALAPEGALALESGSLAGALATGRLTFVDQRVSTAAGALVLSGGYDFAARSFASLAVALEKDGAGSSAVLQGARSAQPSIPTPPDPPADR